MQDRDWALEQLGVELGMNPYELVPLKGLLIRALQSFPAGATVGQIKAYLRDTWGLNILTRRVTVGLSHLHPAGTAAGRFFGGGERVVAAVDLVAQLLNELSAGHSVRWQEAREQIHAEHRQATTTKDRVILLELHRALMDAVERNCVEADKLADFRKTRLQDYRLLLISEAIVGRTDGSVDPVRMGQIAQREADAGRLSTDDELYVLGVGGSVFISGIDPTGKLILQPTAFEKRAAMVCRTLVLGAGLWVLLRKGWPDQILARRLTDLMGELVAAIIGIVFVLAIAGWLFRLLFKPPPNALRTKDWCDGWLWALSTPLLLVGVAAMVVYVLPPPPSSPLTKYAAEFLAEVISLFV